MTKESPFETLDKTQPFGEIHGIDGDARYEQNGFVYDAHCRLMRSRLTPDLKERLKRLEAELAAEQAAEEARQRVLADLGVAPAPAPAPPTPPRVPQPPAVAPGTVDLDAWVRGRAEYPFDKVREAIKTTLKKHVTSLVDAIDAVGKALNVPENQLRQV